MTMNREQILGQVEEICQRVFQDNGLEIDYSSNPSQIAQWDSVTHVSLIVEIEKYYGFCFGLKELRHLEAIGDIVNLIKQKLG